MATLTLLNHTRDLFLGKRKLTSFAKLRQIWGSTIRGSKWQLAKLDLKATPYLNVGCGLQDFPGFVNLDYGWHPGIHVCWDITQGLPFKENSFQGTFSEHCLEHISLSQSKNVLREIFRILKPGGTARFVMPDAEIYLNVYQEKKRGKDAAFPYSETSSKELATPMMFVNEVFRQHGHLYAYDVETFSYLLKEAGFTSVQRTEFKKGNDPKLLIDEPWREVESFYIEGKKPG